MFFLYCGVLYHNFAKIVQIRRNFDKVGSFFEAGRLPRAPLARGYKREG